VKLPLPDGLWIAAVKPDVEVCTAAARAALPAAVPLADVVANLGAMAGLVAGLASGDMGLVGDSLTDRIATPYRRGLIPGYDAVVAAASDAGAIGAGISGSGPTVFALAEGEATATEAGAAMAAAFRGVGLSAVVIVGAADLEGARLETSS
jgi:homoserine kinase